MGKRPASNVISVALTGALTLTSTPIAAIADDSIVVVSDASDQAVILEEQQEDDPIVIIQEDADEEIRDQETTREEPTEDGKAEDEIAGDEVVGEATPSLVSEDASAQVQTIGELQAALEDPTVDQIVLTSNIQMVSTQIVVKRDVVINLNKHILSFTGDGAIVFTEGTSEIRNGSIYGHGEDDGQAPLLVSGGTLTITGNLDVDSEYVETIVASGDAHVVIDEASVYGRSERHPALYACDNARVEIKSIVGHPHEDSTLIASSDAAQVALKHAQIFAKDASNLETYVSEGYRMAKSDIVDIWYVRGDLASSLAQVTVVPATITFDGTAKEPDVRVTFDGEDITDDCDVSYENNVNVGTAKVIVTPKLYDSAFVGTATATFTISEAAVDPTVPLRKVRVSNEAELRAALADRSVSEIVFDASIQLVDIDMFIDHDVVLDLNKYIFSFDDGASLRVRNGNVEIKNGHFYGHGETDEAAPLIVSGGTTTLTGNLDLQAFHSRAVMVSGTARLVVDEAQVDGGDRGLAAITGSDKAQIDIKYITSSLHGRRLVSTADQARVTIRGAHLYTEENPDIDSYIPTGYKLEKSEVADIWFVRGDLSSDLAKVSVSPTTFTYDGTDKEPTVTVTFDGEDVTDECYFSFKNNRNVGTATVSVTPEIGSDVLTGSTSATFQIVNGAQNDLSKATVELIPESFTYDGDAQRPSVWVRLNGHYVSSSDYSVSYANNVNAGTATVTITARDGSNFHGSISKDFTIKPREATVYVYSHWKLAGTADPVFGAFVSGTIGSDTLSYTISREKGETAGTYKISATGATRQGNYTVTYDPGILTIIGSSYDSGSGSTTTARTTTPTTSTVTTTPTTTTTKPSGATTTRAASPATADATPQGVWATLVAGALALFAGERRRRRDS